MTRITHPRTSLCAIALSLLALTSHAQTPATAPASIPANVTNSLPPTPISDKQAREADDAYLDGAKQIQRNDLDAAIRSFARAAILNPSNRDYVMALADAREHKLTELVQSAAKKRLAGDDKAADALLAQARAIDPDNPIVTQHLGLTISPWQSSVDPLLFPPANIASTLDGPPELKPSAAKQSFHRRGDPQDILRAVFLAYGITVSFDTSVTGGASVRLDLDDVDFATAAHIVGKMTHTFAIAVQPQVALIAKDTQENRDKFIPQVEETVYLPGVPTEQMSELANVARNIFDLKKVTASATNGDMLLSGDEATLKLVNATFADMLDGGSDVLLDINVYEIDKTHTVNIGAQLPNSAGVFSVTSELQNIVSQNQSLIQQLVNSGAITLNGNYFHDLAVEAGALLASGAVSLPQYTNLLGVFGSLGSYTNAAGLLTGVPLAGLYLGSASSFQLMLNSTDVRTVDAVRIRGANRTAMNFRSGSRYPVVTATYSSGITSGNTSALAQQAAAAGISQSTINQYLGAAANVSIPQFTFEDLGLTLKATPQILHNSNVSLALEMKIEALAGGSLNSIPILNSRAMTMGITVPFGETALLVSEVSTNELKSLEGVPGLSELPGFQGTEQDREKDSGELLITITPHIVRPGNLHIASRPLATGPAGPSSAP